MKTHLIRLKFIKMGVYRLLVLYAFGGNFVTRKRTSKIKVLASWFRQVYDRWNPPEDLTRAPVVSVDEPHKLLGMIRREDIIRAYNLGLARRSEIRERTTQKQISAVNEVEFLDLLLEAGDGQLENR
jgi:hypothetical protein